MSSEAGDGSQENLAHRGLADDEPLLGRRGDASQPEDHRMFKNLWLGTAILAQAGIWILAGTIWASVLSTNVILFSYHPLFNAAGLLLITQGILILQPTHTASQKRLGTHIHAGLNGAGLLALIGGMIVIEYNKFAHGAYHFISTHGICGLITYIVLVIQGLVGIAQFYAPALFGSVDNAKAVYKYHRISGYLVLTFSFVTVATATQTPFNTGTLHLRLWFVLLTSALVLAGLVPRIKKRKLGW